MKQIDPSDTFPHFLVGDVDELLHFTRRLEAEVIAAPERPHSTNVELDAYEQDISLLCAPWPLVRRVG